MIFSDSSAGRAHEFKLLQEASRLDEEVRMIMVSGYKLEGERGAKERLSLKPFMAREIFQVAAGSAGRGREA